MMTEEKENIDEDIKKTEEAIKKIKESKNGEKDSGDYNIKVIITFIIAIIIIGAIFYFKDNFQNNNTTIEPIPLDSNIISTKGVHLHPNIKIIIKGEEVIIPENTGITPQAHQPMHTHDTTGTIHTEIAGKVLKKDVTLDRFFKIWGKTFSEKCIFENCNGSQGTLRMTVNGVENTEFNNYSVKNGDQIEIIFE